MVAELVSDDPKSLSSVSAGVISGTAYPGTFPDPIPTNRDVHGELRRACAEGLLAGALLISDVSRAMGSYDWQKAVAGTEERFRKAMEAMREALS